MTDQVKPTPEVATTVDNGILTITVRGFAPFVIDPATLPEDLVYQAALHGFKQKYADKAALGKDATTEEKYQSIRSMVEHHRGTGEWNMTAGGDGTSGDGLLVKALQEVAGLDRDAAREAVGAMDKKTQAAMRRDPTIAPVIARLRLEKPLSKAAKSVDTGAYLAQLRARAA